MLQNSQSTPITFRDLGDWQKIVNHPLPDLEVKILLRRKDFFLIPKHNDQILRQQSILIDKILGFDLKALEEKLVKAGKIKMPQGSFEYWGPAIHGGAQTWVGLDVQTLNTPYPTLMRICQLLELKAGMSVVDLGSAHGRLGLVMNQACPQAKFIGYEYVPERVSEANRIYARWGLKNANCFVQDLFAKDFDLPEVDVYFIYDYGRHDHINATIGQISLIAKKRPIRLVARGQVTNKLIAQHHPWLSECYSGELDEHFNIFSAGPESFETEN